MNKYLSGFFLILFIFSSSLQAEKATLKTAHLHNNKSEVFISDCSDLINIAPYGISTSSSYDWIYIHSLVIDRSPSNFFSTVQEDNPYWQVELENTACIDSIVVWNRSGCCPTRLDNAIIEILDASNVVVGTYNIGMASATSNSFSVPSIVGKKVRIRRSGSDLYLHLGEVEVFARVPVDAKVFAIQPSCTDGVANSDGYLQVSTTTGDRVNWSLGSTYTGSTNYSAATAIGSLPFQFNTGLSNPNGFQDYTVRVFDGASACYTDFVVTMNEQDCTFGCTCEEYIYLNEIRHGGRIHKYSVDASDGDLTEIFNAGNTWYPGANASEMGSPHGLGTDLNGYLYIAKNYWGGEIRRLDCDGNIYPTSNFVLNHPIDPGTGIANIQSIGNDLYTNALTKYYICNSTLVDTVELAQNAVVEENWGFYIDERTGYHYSTNSEQENVAGRVWRYTDADYGTGVAVAPLVTLSYLQTYISTLGNEDSFRGVVTDANGNIYVNIWDRNSSDTDIAGHIVKFDSNGNYITHQTDSIDGDGGFFLPAGLVYSETSGLIYASTQSVIDDCVALFDTTLTYLGAAVGPSGDSGEGQNDFLQAKAIAKNLECCPTNNNVMIDTTLCNVAVNDTLLFLQELINCSGTICAGVWNPVSSSGLHFEPCNYSVIVLSPNACGTFVLESDGSGDSAQCGAFKITVNFDVGNITASVIAGD